MEKLSLFRKNLDFFKKYHNDLYQQIISYDGKIDNISLNKYDIYQIKTIHFESFSDNNLDKQTKKAFNNLLSLLNFIEVKNFSSKAKKLLVLGCNSYIPTNYDKVFIYENSFKRFYNLLKFVRFYQFKKVYFCFSEDELLDKLDIFYKDNFFDNFTIDYINNLDNKIFNTISIWLHRNDSMSYPYTKYLRDLKNLHKNKRYKYIDFNKKIFKNKKVLFLAPGPSLEKYIKEVIKHKNNFIIIASIHTISILDRFNLYPDFLIVSDSDKIMRGFIKTDDKKYFQIPLLADICVDSKLIKKFKKVFLFDINKENFLANTISEVSYQLILKLGAKDIYLLGVDLSFNKDSKQYSSGYKNLCNSKIDTNNLIKTKGNKTDFVYTDFFYKSILDIFKTINKNKDIKCFNFSDGAKIYGCNRCEFDRFSKEDKDIKIEVVEYKIDFDFEIELNYFEINSKDEFFDYFLYIIKNLLLIEQDSYEKKLFYKIMYNYLNITLNFINFFINSDSKIDYNLLSKELFNQILKIVEVLDE